METILLFRGVPDDDDEEEDDEEEPEDEEGEADDEDGYSEQGAQERAQNGYFGLEDVERQIGT